MKKPNQIDLRKSKNQPLPQAFRTPAIHACINAEVAEARVAIDPCDAPDDDYINALMETLCQHGIDCHHTTRTRASTLKAIAFLEHTAALLRDEIADQAYLPTPITEPKTDLQTLAEYLGKEHPHYYHPSKVLEEYCAKTDCDLDPTEDVAEDASTHHRILHNLFHVLKD